MRKLTRSKLVELFGLRGRLSAYRVGKRFGVSARWTRALWKRFEREGAWERRKPGFPSRPFSPEEVAVVAKTYARVKVGALQLESVLKAEGVRLSHNRIHAILRALGKARRERSKSQRRAWIRYERHYSNSLWHTDWTKLKGKWLVAFEDDASRLVVAYGLFERATSDNSVLVLRQGVAQYGTPKAILTGHDVQFYASGQKGKPSRPNAFQRALAELHVKHVLGRVNHPQTNGKIERFFGTVKRKLREFNNLDELVDWYNTIRPHMSLRRLETPAQAYVRKTRQKTPRPKEMIIIHDPTKTQRGT